MIGSVDPGDPPGDPPGPATPAAGTARESNEEKLDSNEDENKNPDEDGNVTKENIKEALEEIENEMSVEKAALVKVSVKDGNKKDKTRSFLYLPKSFQYTVTKCFCGGSCQEVHVPDKWRCNDTCRRICKTACTVCGTRAL